MDNGVSKEEYKLVLLHTYTDSIGDTHNIDEPITCCVSVCNMDSNYNVHCKNTVINELMRLMREFIAREAGNSV